jgi:hypothetical protein
MLSSVILTCTVGCGGYHARYLSASGIGGRLPTELGLLTELTEL